MAQLNIEGDNKNFCTLEAVGENEDETQDQGLNVFKELVKNNPAVVIDFHATWCGPCKQIGPKFKDMAKEFANVKFLKVDVDDFDGIASENSIDCMPTFLFFKNGEKADSLSGANEDKLRSKIAEISK